MREASSTEFPRGLKILLFIYSLFLCVSRRSTIPRSDWMQFSRSDRDRLCVSKLFCAIARFHNQNFSVWKTSSLESLLNSSEPCLGLLLDAAVLWMKHEAATERETSNSFDAMKILKTLFHVLSPRECFEFLNDRFMYFYQPMACCSAGHRRHAHTKHLNPFPTDFRQRYQIYSN